MLLIEDAFKLYREMDVVGVERDSCLKKKIKIEVNTLF